MVQLLDSHHFIVEGAGPCSGTNFARCGAWAIFGDVSQRMMVCG